MLCGSDFLGHATRFAITSSFKLGQCKSSSDLLSPRTRRPRSNSRSHLRRFDLAHGGAQIESRRTALMRSRSGLAQAATRQRMSTTLSEWIFRVPAPAKFRRRMRAVRTSSKKRVWPGMAAFSEVRDDNVLMLSVGPSSCPVRQSQTATAVRSNSTKVDVGLR
jgi:hypothetical protein